MRLWALGLLLAACSGTDGSGLFGGQSPDVLGSDAGAATGGAAGRSQLVRTGGIGSSPETGGAPNTGGISSGGVGSADGGMGTGGVQSSGGRTIETGGMSNTGGATNAGGSCGAFDPECGCGTQSTCPTPKPPGMVAYCDPGSQPGAAHCDYQCPPNSAAGTLPGVFCQENVVASCNGGVAMYCSGNCTQCPSECTTWKCALDSRPSAPHCECR